MNLWWQVPLLVCAVAISLAFVAALLALRQTLHRADRLLAALEHELHPTLGELRGLTHEASAVTREARSGVARRSATAERVAQVADGLGGLLVGVRGIARFGQIVAVAAGLRRGIDVFVDRMAASRGGRRGRAPQEGPHE